MISAAHLLDLWDAGNAQHPVDRAITLLRLWQPEYTRAELAGLSLGARDGLLLDLREAAFGPSLNAFSDCPACGSHLEYGLTVANLRVAGPELPPGTHVPDSYDLAAAARAPSIEEARRILAERCSPESAELDPQGDIVLTLACAACSHSWDELLDISSFLWTEISAAARLVLREVDTLARVYGWSERDILDMSASRRATYLELANG